MSSRQSGRRGETERPSRSLVTLYIAFMYVQRVLGRAVGNNMLFVHAVLGCDTTYRVFSMGKGLSLKHIRSDNHFITQAEIFLQENATLADISSAGDAALVCLYTCAVGDTL